MNRRSFLGLLASVPIIGALAKALPAAPEPTTGFLMGIHPDGHLFLRDADWTSYDPYGTPPQITHYYHTEGFYKWATDNPPGRPIMISEWGFDV